MKNAQQFGSPDATPVAGRTEVTQCPTAVANRITSIAQMVPGQLYCLFTIEGFGDEQYDASGALVWRCSDGNLYDADSDSGEPVRSFFDYAVAQTGAFNQEYAA